MEKFNGAVSPKLSLVASAVFQSILCVGAMHGTAEAATIEVTANTDSNGINCELREAVKKLNDMSIGNGCSNSSSEDFGTNDTIDFSQSVLTFGIIILDEVQGPIVINDDLMIDADSNITIDGNNSTRVFDIQSTTVTMNQLTVANGSTTNNGGGINVYGSLVTLSNTSVTGNSANSGGGIYAHTGSTLILTNSSVSNNFAVSQDGGQGGGVFIYDSTINLSAESSISNNSSNHDGGGVFSRESIISLTDSSIINNSVTSFDEGGGIYADSSTITLTNSILSNNSSGSSGAGISATFSSIVTLIDSSLRNNSTGSSGGGINSNLSTITLENSTISDNNADSMGGGANAYDSVIYSSESSIDNNTGRDGGGIYSHFARVEFSNTTLQGNSALLSGGGIYSNNSIFSIENSTLSGNFATRDGGGIHSVYNFGNSVNINNSTITGNSAAREGNGVMAGSYSNFTISNSVFSNVSSGDDCSQDSDSTVSIDTNTIVHDGSCDATRMGNPQLGPLADNSGTTLTHALLPTSPARASGHLGTCTIIDQRGQIRNDGDGACDVGAIEFNPDDDFGEVESSFYVVPMPDGKTVIIPL